MPDQKITDLVDGGDPQGTDDFVVARAGDNFKVAWSSMAAAATEGNIAVTLDGNTAGALADISSGTLTLAGGNNITLSQAGNAVTISGANAAGAQTAISGLANSEVTYTSGTVELVADGALTIASNAGQQFIFSVDPQSVQPETQTFVGGISASNALYTSGTVRFTGSQAVTVRSGTGQLVVIDAPAQSVQPETQTFIAGISASDTLYTSGNVRFTGSQAATVRSGTGQLVVIDVPAQSVQPETQTFIAGISASDTLYTSGNVRFTGVGGGVTVSSNTGQRVDISVAAPVAATNLSVGVSTGGNTSGNTGVNTGSRFVIVGTNGITASQGTAAGATTVTLSGITQSVQTQGVLSVGVSTGGNTAGDTGVNTGTRMIFEGRGDITLSQITAAGASILQISGSQTAQTQGILNAGVSNVGNTSGATTVNSGTRLVFAGGNNITLSQGTAANATTITISAPNLGAGAMSAGVSNLGNTAGSTGITGTQLVLVGSGVMSLSQSTGANGGTVSINAPATSSLSATGLVSISTNGSTISIGVPGSTLRRFDPNAMGSKVVGVFPGNATLVMQPWEVPVPYQHDRVMYPVQYSQATNSTLTVTVSGWFGLYTSNASTLSLLSSGSGTFSINGSGTASSANNSGLRFLTFPWTNTVPPGQYWLGAVSRTTTAGANASLSNVAINIGVSNSAWSGIMGIAAASTQQMQLGLGTWTVTTAGMPNSVAFSHLAGSTSANHRVPWIWFLSQSV